MLTKTVTKFGYAGLHSQSHKGRGASHSSRRAYWSVSQKAAKPKPVPKAADILQRDLKPPSFKSKYFVQDVAAALKRTFFGDTTDMRAPNEPFAHYMFAKVDRRLYWEMRTCPLPTKEEWEDFWVDNDYICHEHWRPESPLPFDMKNHLERPGGVEDLRMFWYNLKRHPLSDDNWLREENSYMSNLEEKIESVEMTEKFTSIMREITADMDLPKSLTDEEVESMAAYEPTPEGKEERIKHIRKNEELVIMARALDAKVGKLRQLRRKKQILTKMESVPTPVPDSITFDAKKKLKDQTIFTESFNKDFNPEEKIKEEKYAKWSDAKKERQLFVWRSVMNFVQDRDDAIADVKEGEAFLEKVDKALAPLETFIAEFQHMAERRSYKLHKLYRLIKVTGASDSIARAKITRLWSSLLSVNVLPEHRDLFMHEHDISFGEYMMEWLQPCPAPVETYEEMPIIKDFDEPEDWEDADEHSHY